jgi:hypothetical protein
VQPAIKLLVVRCDDLEATRRFYERLIENERP